MKNADMPAMPMNSKLANRYLDEYLHADIMDTVGLTKREMIAINAMQGYISGNLAWTDGLDGGAARLSHEEAAKEAVSFADALLAELDK